MQYFPISQALRSCHRILCVICLLRLIFFQFVSGNNRLLISRVTWCSCPVLSVAVFKSIFRGTEVTPNYWHTAPASSNFQRVKSVRNWGREICKVLVKSYSARKAFRRNRVKKKNGYNSWWIWYCDLRINGIWELGCHDIRNNTEFKVWENDSVWQTKDRDSLKLPRLTSRSFPTLSILWFCDFMTA